MARSSFTLCWVGLVLSSCAAAIQGTSVTCTNSVFSRPSSCRSWRIASRNGSDSISPTVPPISQITTSAGDCSDGARHAAHGGLDLIGHVRNHLHGFSQVIAAPLARNDLLVDAPAGEVIGLRQRRVREALVVAQVEIGFGAIVGDEHLAVLERAHGAGIDVQVGIEFLQRDFEAAALEKTAEARRRDPFTQGRNHTAGYENIFGHVYRFTIGFSNNSATCFQSSGVSTPSDSYSVSTTRILKPFSSARNCSRRSARSSGPTGKSG